MALLELLRRAREGRSSILHQYLLNAGKAPLAIHAFVEGRPDRIFYGSFLRDFFRGRAQVFSYICGNKRGVYRAYEVIEPELRAEDYALYFVDKDLDDLIPVEFAVADEIYVTDHYSIENYLVTRAIVESVWTEIYRQEPAGDAFARVAQRFAEALEAFHVLSKQIAAWMIHHRRRGANPQANNIDLRRIASVTAELALAAPASDDELTRILDDCCQVETDAAWNDERQELTELVDAQPAKAVTKGKLELAFLVAFLGAVRQLLDEAAKAEGRRLRASLAISEANAMEILGPRLPMPGSLRTFLERALKRLEPHA